MAVFKKREAQPPFDYHFFVTVMILLAAGLAMVFSASYATADFYYGDSLFFVKRQLAWAALGLVMMFVTTRIDYQKLAKFALHILVISIVLLVAVLIPGIGVSVLGARRWLGFGQFSFQPSEVAKLGLVIFFSASLSKNYDLLKKFWTGLAPYLFVLGLFAVLLLLEPHFSCTLLIGVTSVIILITAGAKWKHLGLLAAPVGGAVALVAVIEPYRLVRILTFLNPFAYPDKEGWQIIQSLYAIGSGGLFGVGLGRGVQKYLYLPEPQNDFIFSVLCEEMGWVGAIIVIALFIYLIWRGLRIAAKAKDMFGTLMTTGIVALIGVQALVNIAVVTSSMPVTGMPLPFFSAGGSALVFTLMGMGIVLNVSRTIGNN